jgi:hypothetical protein
MISCRRPIVVLTSCSIASFLLNVHARFERPYLSGPKLEKSFGNVFYCYDCLYYDCINLVEETTGVSPGEQLRYAHKLAFCAQLMIR